MTNPATDRHPYSVRRSDRAKRARVTVDREGRTVVVLPRRWPLIEADRLVARHAAWIDRHVTQVRSVQAQLAGRPALGQGRILHVAGEGLRISTVDGMPRPVRGSVEAMPGGLVVRLGRDEHETASLLQPWLCARAREVIAERIEARAAEMNVRPGRLTIRDQSSRWASASARGSLSFSWRLLLAPPYVLDAVVVHELAHLRIRDHSPRFWALVGRHAPRTAEARRWLREHSHELRAALE